MIENDCSRVSPITCPKCHMKWECFQHGCFANYNQDPLRTAYYKNLGCPDTAYNNNNNGANNNNNNNNNNSKENDTTDSSTASLGVTTTSLATLLFTAIFVISLI